MSKKGKIFLTVIGVLVIVAVAILASPKGKELFSSVINISKPIVIKPQKLCLDTDGGMMPYIIGITKGVDAITHQVVQSHDYCLPGTNNWLVEYFCAYNYVVNQLVDCTNNCGGGGLCNQGGTGYGYGYGYGRGGPGTGYGYGYGYGKIDPNTNKPYIYLINVFKTYTKSIYEAAVNKLGSFKMVKSYNKKEFSPTTSTR